MPCLVPRPMGHRRPAIVVSPASAISIPRCHRGVERHGGRKEFRQDDQIRLPPEPLADETLGSREALKSRFRGLTASVLMPSRAAPNTKSPIATGSRPSAARPLAARPSRSVPNC